MVEFTAEKYIADVLSGRVVACKWVKLACQRHADDLEDGHLRGLWFDAAAAKLVIAFFSLLKHSKGEWAGTAVNLESWQQAHLWILFGWKRADGTRRFRVSYMEIARKNGKSLVAAGVGLFLLIADDEPGAEIYTLATKLEQAKIIHAEATRMVRQSNDLLKEVGLFTNSIHVEASFSKYEPLGADSTTLDGLNAHAGLVDELHAHPNRDLWDIIRTSQGARRQPLMYAITTAGHDQTSFCYEMHRYTQQILERVVEDDSFYGIIYALDEEDEKDWQNPALWIKANPNLGVSKKLEKMQEEAREAEHVPSALNTFLRLHLDVWTKAEKRWVKLEAWDVCAGPISFRDLPGFLVGRECYAGLDLASTIDIAALVLVFPPGPDEELFYLLPYFWIPGENIRERSHRDQVPYEAWVREGLIEATEGNVIDYGAIKKRIEAAGERYFLREIAFDRWGAFQISQDLAALGFEVIPFGQGYASMSAPMKELLKLILERKLAHGGHPVLRWMADNLVVETDAAANIKPNKAKSRQKIDGIVASIMGLDRSIRHEENSPGITIL